MGCKHRAVCGSGAGGGGGGGAGSPGGAKNIWAQLGMGGVGGKDWVVMGQRTGLGPILAQLLVARPNTDWKDLSNGFLDLDQPKSH